MTLGHDHRNACTPCTFPGDICAHAQCLAMNIIIITIKRNYFQFIYFTTKYLKRTMYRSLLYLSLLLIHYTASAPGSRKARCIRPTAMEVKYFFETIIPTDETFILRTHFTCLAVRGRDLYHSASVLVQTNTSQYIKQFEIECNENEEWSLSGSSLDTTNTSLFNIPTRYDCYQCIADTSGPHRKTKGHRHSMISWDESTHCRGELMHWYIMYCVSLVDRMQ